VRSSRRHRPRALLPPPAGLARSSRRRPVSCPAPTTGRPRAVLPLATHLARSSHRRPASRTAPTIGRPHALLPPPADLAPLPLFLPLSISPSRQRCCVWGRWSSSGQETELHETGGGAAPARSISAVFFFAGFFVATFGLCFCIIRTNFCYIYSVNLHRNRRRKTSWNSFCSDATLVQKFAPTLPTRCPAKSLCKKNIATMLQ
jgi:hypothetical protein